MQVKKAEKVNLEKRKFSFLLLGFVLALTICLVAFEWSSEEIGLGALGDLSMEEFWEEEIESTIHDEDIPEPEPEPEPEIEEVFEELLIVEDDVEVDTRLDIDAEATERTETRITIPAFEEEEEELDPIPFVEVQDKPEFPGGDAALLRFIADNTRYPEIARENGIQGRVFVRFVIDVNGKVTDVRIERGVDPYLDQEAIRVVRAMPDWKPGKQRGQPVPVIFILPINFRLY